MITEINLSNYYIRKTEIDAIFNPNGDNITSEEAIERAIKSKADKEHTHAYLTEEVANGKYQQKGNYLTSVPAHTDANGGYGKATESVYGHVKIGNKAGTVSEGNHTHDDYLDKDTADGYYQSKGNYLDKTTADGYYQSKGNYLDTTTASNTYLKKTDASSAYLNKTDANSTYQPKGDYLTIDDVEDVYQPKGDYLTKTTADGYYQAKGDYLDKTTASNTYLKKTDASNTYLTETNASNTYLTQNDASSTYLTKTDAGSMYQPKVSISPTITNDANSIPSTKAVYDITYQWAYVQNLSQYSKLYVNEKIRMCMATLKWTNISIGTNKVHILKDLENSNSDVYDVPEQYRPTELVTAPGDSSGHLTIWISSAGVISCRDTADMSGGAKTHNISCTLMWGYGV